ncbi:unnamed protein product [Caenorhabditis sp. 36 PRJEB53466]|nr:unnamed protein product [Caenorhabditis sp. 36 PRJEB53466]
MKAKRTPEENADEVPEGPGRRADKREVKFPILEKLHNFTGTTVKMLKLCFTLLLVLLLVATVSSDKLFRHLQRLRRSEAEYADGQDGDFFVRSAKWVSKMTPSGGALVSGRGGFRPGFVARDWRHVLAEPNFNKRSSYYNDY